MIGPGFKAEFNTFEGFYYLSGTPLIPKTRKRKEKLGTIIIDGSDTTNYLWNSTLDEIEDVFTEPYEFNFKQYAIESISNINNMGLDNNSINISDGSSNGTLYLENNVSRPEPTSSINKLLELSNINIGSNGWKKFGELLSFIYTNFNLFSDPPNNINKKSKGEEILIHNSVLTYFENRYNATSVILSKNSISKIDSGGSIVYKNALEFLSIEFDVGDVPGEDSTTKYNFKIWFDADRFHTHAARYVYDIIMIDPKSNYFQNNNGISIDDEFRKNIYDKIFSSSNERIWRGYKTFSTERHYYPNSSDPSNIETFSQQFYILHKFDNVMATDSAGPLSNTSMSHMVKTYIETEILTDEKDRISQYPNLFNQQKVNIIPMYNHSIQINNEEHYITPVSMDKLRIFIENILGRQNTVYSAEVFYFGGDSGNNNSIIFSMPIVAIEDDRTEVEDQADSGPISSRYPHYRPSLTFNDDDYKNNTSLTIRFQHKLFIALKIAYGILDMDDFFNTSGVSGYSFAYLNDIREMLDLSWEEVGETGWLVVFVDNNTKFYVTPKASVNRPQSNLNLMN